MQTETAPQLQTYTRVSMIDPHATDSALIEATLNGDSGAYRLIYERYAPKMYRLAYRFHGNEQDAQDSLQDAFINAYRNLAKFKADAHLATWLYRITMNACISRGRSNKKHKSSEFPVLELIDPRAGRSHSDTRLADLLNREILNLKDKHRAVFLLFAVEGFSHAEIAATMGIPENTSKSLYFRAKQTLVKRLEKHGITKDELIQ